MKILFITSGALPMPPVKGGAVENLVQELIDYNEYTLKHEYEVYSIYNEKIDEYDKNFQRCSFKYIKIEGLISRINKIARYIINKNFPIYIGNAYIIKVIKEIKKSKKKYDVIIVENSPEYIIPLSKKIKGKIVLHLHNDYLNCSSKFGKKILDESTQIYTLSEFVNEKVQQIYPTNKVKTLYNGINVERFMFKKHERDFLRLKYNIRESDTVFLYTGRIVREKGVKELISAFTKFPNGDNSLKLVIVGSCQYGQTIQDSYLKECKEIAEKQKDNIIFTGYIKYNDMPKYYSMSDIGVVPSTGIEGFALTIVEQMAAGLPVIISNSGGMVELVNDKCAVIVDLETNFEMNLYTAMNKLRSDKNICENMGKEAIKQAQKFNKDKYVARFEYLLTTVEEIE